MKGFAFAHNRPISGNSLQVGEQGKRTSCRGARRNF